MKVFMRIKGDVPKQQHPAMKTMTTCIVYHLLALRYISFIIYENYYIKCLLLLSDI